MLRILSPLAVPALSFALAILMAALCGPSSRAIARAPQQASGSCHTGTVTPGSDRQVRAVDGLPPGVTAPPADCITGNVGPVLQASPRRALTIDCRKKKGHYMAFAWSIGQANSASGGPSCESGNTVIKELTLTGSNDNCCHTYSSSAVQSFFINWVIITAPAARTGILGTGNHGEVLINDPGHPQENRIRVDYKDCAGKAHFIERSLQTSLEAVVIHNQRGQVTTNASSGSLQRFLETDVTPRIPAGTREIGGPGALGFATETLYEPTQVSFKPSGSTRHSGGALVVAESPTGARSGASVTFNRMVNDHAVKDTDENVTVPDP